MLTFFNTGFGLIITIGGVAGMVIIGALYLIGVWRGKKDGEDDRLINILKTTVDELEKKVNQQTIDIGELTRKVTALEGENETLVKVLQGRDDKTQEFYKKAFEAIDVGNKTFALVEQMNKNHIDLMKLLVDHLKPGVTINNQPGAAQ